MASALLAGLTILIIGDSHMVQVPLAPSTFTLMVALHDDLLGQGATVHSVGVCGSVPTDWVSKPVAGKCGGSERSGDAPLKQDAKTTPIKTLVAADSPDLILVVMGDTMAGYKTEFPKVWFWQEITSLAKEIASTKVTCAWIGLAWGTEGGHYGKTFARVERVSGTLSKGVAPCTYIDSQKFSAPGAWPTLDGVHYTVQGYQTWAAAITKAVIDLRKEKKLKP